MVRPAWRSKTCATCRSRKVKCDQTLPTCQRCNKAGLVCDRPYQDGNVNISRIPSPVTLSETVRDTPPQNLAPGQIIHGNNEGTYPGYELFNEEGSGHTMQPIPLECIPTTASMDSRVEPNLSRQAINTQEREIFRWFVGANFFRMYLAYARRMDVTWLAFIFEPKEDPPPFLECAIRCISFLHLGLTNGNMEFIGKSQAWYGEALNKGRNVPPAPNPSNNAFAAVILLALFEMKNPGCQDSWLTHADGITSIMEANGPAAYSSGFGRTLFLTFRPFLIRAALIRGKECFLESDKWTSMVKTTAEADCHAGRGSQFATLVEDAFNEIVKTPGFVLRAKVHSPEDGLLPHETNDWELRLKGIQEDLTNTLILLRDPRPDNLIVRRDYLGLIPPATAYTVAKLSLDGIQSALELFRQTQGRLSMQTRHGRGIGSRELGLAQISNPTLETQDDHRHHAMPSYEIPVGDGWLDHCALSMGVLSSEELIRGGSPSDSLDGESRG